MTTALLLNFCLVLCISFAGVLAVLQPSKESRTLAGRLRDIRNPARADQPDSLSLALADEDISWLTALCRRLRHLHFVAALDCLLKQAGSGVPLGRFLVLSAGCGGLFWCLAGFAMPGLWPGVIASVTGLAVPLARLKLKRGRRLRAFNRVLPEAIDLMARSLRAGHSVQQALEMISEQMSEPLRAEFAHVHREQKFGVPFREALCAMNERIPSQDLKFVITAILIQKDTGGDLIGILDRTTSVIRDRLRVEGEVKTCTAQGRLTGWILSLLPVVMLVLISLTARDYAALLLHDPLGQKLLAAGASMILAGAVIIQRIVRVEV